MSDFDYLKSHLIRPGKCPQVKKEKCEEKLENKCYSDYDCEGILKCCADQCGTKVCQGKLLNLIKKFKNIYYWFLMMNY